MCLLCEEFARGQIPMGFFPITMMAARPVSGSRPTSSSRRSYRDRRGQVEAIAMSEPEAGSDVGKPHLPGRALERQLRDQRPEDVDHRRARATHTLLVCRTSRSDDKHHGLSMISIPAGADGMEVRPIETMGGREVNDMYFTDCQVPAERLVGREDHAWTQLMAGLNNERLIIAAQSLGMAQRAFDDVLAYVKERKQFGRPIGSFQTIKHRLADLATEIEATRLLVYSVAARADAQPEAMLPREASMAKLKSTELAKRMPLEGMQMMGGAGYAVEYDMERQVRNALVTTIYGGTSEIQREIISKTLGL